MTESGGEVIGRYTVEREIGRGGMAIVYLAHDPQLGRPVAIKLIRKGAFPPDHMTLLLERFRREARALGRLNHPNIVKVLDYGEFRGAPYLVMEYLKGSTLKEIKKPIKVDTAVRLLRPIADALDYVHRQGILHRDIKPSNLMFDGRDRVLLTDFGIAKWLDDDGEQRTLTETGMGIGTPEYMAPEQGLGRKVDGRADFYALAVVFFELVTGTKPYRGETPFATMMKHANDPIPDPRALVPELNESVTRFLLTAMAKDPMDRYASVQDFLRDFDGLALQARSDRALGMTVARLHQDQEKTKLDREPLIGAPSVDDVSDQAVTPVKLRNFGAIESLTKAATEQRIVGSDEERLTVESIVAHPAIFQRDVRKKRSGWRILWIIFLCLVGFVSLHFLYSFLVNISDDTQVYRGTDSGATNWFSNPANLNNLIRFKTDEITTSGGTATKASSMACPSWDGVEVDYVFGNSIQLRRTKSQVERRTMIGGMIVFSPPSSIVGTEWEAAISPNAFDEDSTRAKCEWLENRLFCGPFEFIQINYGDEIRVTVYEAGSDCVGTNGTIDSDDLRPVWDKLENKIE